MSKFIILSNTAHPFYEKLKSLDYTFYNIEKDEPFENRTSHYNSAEAIFDLCSLEGQKKEKLLTLLNKEYKVPIISDLTCHWGERLLKLYPNIKGAVGCQFYSPKETYEVYSANQNINGYIEELFSKLEISSFNVESPGCGFNYPRTIAMIINEAFFSLEDELASKEDIDTAMKYGVNYPLGPFEWANKIGLKKIILLLEELYYMSGDQRYRISSQLKLEAL